MTLVQNHQVSVLVADTDAVARGMVHECLIADGYSCRAVGSIAAAVASAREKKPDLLISDMNLSDGTGIGLLRQLRTIADCPVIFVSDSRDAEMVRFARNAGATFFLAKPVDADVLMELVDKALWMPHLVQRHVDSAAHAAHQVKAPTFSLSGIVGSKQSS